MAKWPEGGQLFVGNVGSIQNEIRTNKPAPEGTFFSQERFVRAVERAEGNASVRVLKVQSVKSSACIFGIERIRRLNMRSISLAPFGLFAYPMHAERLNNCISLIVAQLKTFQTVSFDWTVRFDHTDLANQLENCGLHRFESTTQVLYLDRPYELLFKAFSQTTRNQIRRAKRKVGVVSRATHELDVARYYDLYKKVNEQRGRETIFSKELLMNCLN